MMINAMAAGIASLLDIIEYDLINSLGPSDAYMHQ